MDTASKFPNLVLQQTIATSQWHLMPCLKLFVVAVLVEYSGSQRMAPDEPTKILKTVSFHYSTKTFYSIDHSLTARSFS